MKPNLQTHTQSDAYASPWSLRRRLTLLTWDCVWPLTCAWTPKPLNPWRLLVLKLFGTEIHGTPFVHQHARIQQPWNLVLHHRACLGDRATAYSLDRIVLHEGATVAQEAYLCTGTHDFTQAQLPLQTGPIVVGRGAFVGARAFVLPGLTLGAHCIVGAMSVVTRDVAPGEIVAGNPARTLGQHPVS
ncbi:MAG TPA: putative colanic acid biosynthesis acetyltransferase [Opitutaceae bacterium]|jgi:putative colanic acid biosynthesis acetyltransferase WcaF|nr:putative colanic acid biosynthesis acetyltransferase [Opitutaceae bacterium]